MIYLQNLANQLLDVFIIDTNKVTMSQILSANTPALITVPKGQYESKARLTCGRPISSKDKVLQKRNEHVKTHEEFNTPEEFGAPKETIFSE